jgi:hypothetical protein
VAIATAFRKLEEGGALCPGDRRKVVNDMGALEGLAEAD